MPKKLFLAIAFLSCFICYAKPDYNLPLFVIAYLLCDIDRPVQFQFQYCIFCNFIEIQQIFYQIYFHLTYCVKSFLEIIFNKDLSNNQFTYFVILGLLILFGLCIGVLFGILQPLVTIGLWHLSICTSFVSYQLILKVEIQIGYYEVRILGEKECKNELHSENAMAHTKNISNSDGKHQ